MDAATEQQRPLSTVSIADENLLKLLLADWPHTRVLAGVPEGEDDAQRLPAASAAPAIQPSGTQSASMLRAAEAPERRASASASGSPSPPTENASALKLELSTPAGSGEHMAALARAAAARAAASPKAAAAEGDADDVGAVIIRPELMQAPAGMVEDSMDARSASPPYDTQPSGLGDGEDGNSGSGSGAMPAVDLGEQAPPVFVMTNCHSPNMCGHCGTHTTSGCWRRGWPLDLEGGMTEYMNLCNKCGLRYKSGKLGPEGDVRDGAPTPPPPPPPPPRRTPPVSAARCAQRTIVRAKPSAAAAALMAATEPGAGGLGSAGEVDDAFRSIRALLGSGRGYTLGSAGVSGDGPGSAEAAAAAANLAAATAAELAAASRAQLALLTAAAEADEAPARTAGAAVAAGGREAHPRKRQMGSVSYDMVHANGHGAEHSAAGAAGLGGAAAAGGGAVGGDDRPASRIRRRSKKARGATDLEASDIDMADALLQLGNGHAQGGVDNQDLLLSHETLDQNGDSTQQPRALPPGMHESSAPVTQQQIQQQQRHVMHAVPSAQQRNGRSKPMASGGGGGGGGRNANRNGGMQAAVEAAARQAAIAQRQALVAAWSTQDVQGWLSAVGCDEAAPLFGSHGIDGPAMVGLVRLAREEAAGRLHGLLRQEVGLKGSLGQQLRLVDRMMGLFEPSK